MPTLAEQFWSKVNKNGPYWKGSQCWVWQGSKYGDGYGQFYQGKGSTRSAHRISYTWLVGPIPSGLEIDHLCRNHSCVNPKHLEPVTRQINLLRGLGMVPVRAAVTHCPKGHLYDAVNTYIAPNRTRKCRTCRKVVSQEFEKTRVRK